MISYVPTIPTDPSPLAPPGARVDERTPSPGRDGGGESKGPDRGGSGRRAGEVPAFHVRTPSRARRRRKEGQRGGRQDPGLARGRHLRDPWGEPRPPARASGGGLGRGGVGRVRQKSRRRLRGAGEVASVSDGEDRARQAGGGAGPGGGRLRGFGIGR